MARQVEEAVAAACNVPHDAVRDANNRLGDLARVALAARRGELSAIEARLFHPMEFMLAKPLDKLEDLPSPADWIIEDKYDGIRSQVHYQAGYVRIYSRGMEEVTAAFPEIRRAFESIPGNGLIDGELLAWRDARALNFNVLQQRLARKNVRATLMAEVPVVFMGYDMLLHNDRLLLQQPIEERRRILLDTLGPVPLPILVSPEFSASDHPEIDRLFTSAREHGNEGLLLKRRGSIYEPGKRGGAWLKLKRPYGTLDVVITSAEQGSGRRATVFSDYTFAVRSPEGFLNVGKAYSGLTDVEVKELTRVLRAASTDRFGPVMVVRPEAVLEVAFDGVQKSSRHKSGYALRFPRILRWRRDKKPGECDDIARVEALYKASVQ
jgi:DNA ligase-1